MIQWLFIIIDKGWTPRWFRKAVDHFQNTWLPGLADEVSSCPRAALFSWAQDTKTVCVTRWAFSPNQSPFLFVFCLHWIKLIGAFYGVFFPFEHLKLHNYNNGLCSYNGCAEYICPILCFSNTISTSI